MDVKKLLDDAEIRYYNEHGDEEKDIRFYEEFLHEANKYYRKHTFDDDQTICKNYHEIILSIKQKIKELNGQAQQHQTRSGLDSRYR